MPETSHFIRMAVFALYCLAVGREKMLKVVKAKKYQLRGASDS